jgi:hypothetical protein
MSVDMFCVAGCWNMVGIVLSVVFDRGGCGGRWGSFLIK